MRKINISDKISQIKKELIEANDKLSNIGPAVAVFGSARILSQHSYYKATEDIAKLLASSGYSIITGGGFGLMEAANKGAKYSETPSVSIGLNIKLPFEQDGNKYQDVSTYFENFSTRKMMFMCSSSAFVVMPGGYGTLDELSEILTLIQTGKINSAPIILVNSDFWRGLISWFKDEMLKSGLISTRDINMFYVVDHPHEILNIIKKHIPVGNVANKGCSYARLEKISNQDNISLQEVNLFY